ncbi:MAG: M18 family aminopeptidase [Gammaproteobacteria bacterium]|jgi:aspartyl aminopeptidase|nr:M18 family aminopeptidase [Gammaproteobacteria bacterium]MBT4145895.1 M18 family aminopeptidase [Gammaproteobacteria bacterium]MBT5221526.1 M18 family aminopeptidase [Gammaproteobacteria bacterium]MBT5825423.1 M18 family aminopeptidase [Gammaproteobacteria bacterium]MBT5966760.1 M18 family aminopeptidase [Gammaproteobacteria bacterium]
MTDKAKVQQLLDFIDASPSPWHAVVTMEQALLSASFTRLSETQSWQLDPGGRYYVVRDDSSIIAFVVGDKSLPESGYKIIGAHTDSPGLRIKPHALHQSGEMLRMGVEVYGGPILATFTDRDLSFAGRVSYRSEAGEIETQLVRFEESLLRLPNLAIHMNRMVNEEGLKLNKQTELPLLFAMSSKEQMPDQLFSELLVSQCQLLAEQVMSWELNVYDTQKGAFWGAQQEFYTDSQLDNLASCHAGLSALLDETALQSGNTLVCAFFDHEEVGSESTKGADGSFLPDTLERIALARSLKTEDYKRALAKSFMLSVDMAHAYQPNFPVAYESEHKVYVNKGPVIKLNANQRYSSESVSEAMFMSWCQEANVPFQKYSHRTDIPCGSTIGPMTSAKLGIRSVDVGNAMWAMHSIRESAGVLDHAYMIAVMQCFFKDQK